MAPSRRHLPLALIFGLTALGTACKRAPAPAAPPPPAALPAAAPPPPTVALERESAMRESSGILLARVQTTHIALVADEDDSAIVEVDRDGKHAPAPSPLSSAPRDLLLLPDGTVAATLPHENAVVVLAREKNFSKYREVKRLSMPPEPLAMALDASDRSLYVTTGASHALVAFSIENGKPLGRADLPRQPRAALVSADGAHVFVSHATTGVVSVVDAASLRATIIDVGRREIGMTEGPSVRARLARHGQSLARTLRDGKEAVVVPLVQVQPKPELSSMSSKMMMEFPQKPIPPQMFDNPGVMKSDGFRAQAVTGYGLGGDDGPPEFTQLRVIDTKAGKVSDEVFDGMTGSACLLPRAAVASGERIYVACMGDGKIAAFNDRSKSAQSLSLTQSFDVDKGSQALALDLGEKLLYVWSAVARRVSIVNLAEKRPSVQTRIDFPRGVARPEAWLHGRELFFTTGDKRISGDGRGCASCHIDGQDDAVTWSTPSGLRRTRTLAGQLTQQGPYGWRGEHKTLEEHVKVTFKQLAGKGLEGSDFDDLLTYARALPGPANAAGGSANALSEQEKKGHALFSSPRFDCAGCHTDGGRVTDRAVHDVGTGGSFMTPTLAGVAKRTEWMHDGRFSSLDLLLQKSRDMGNASSLDEDERRAMIAYLATL